jgi:hypothetical protein
MRTRLARLRLAGLCWFSMKKDEALRRIVSLAIEWASKTGVVKGQSDMLSFRDFQDWANSNGYGHYFDFRTTEGPMEAAENAFDDALGQSWRN